MGLTQSTPEQPKQNSSSWFGTNAPAAPAAPVAPAPAVPGAVGGARRRKHSSKKLKGGKRKSGKKAK